MSKSHGNTSMYVDTVINFAKYHIGRTLPKFTQLKRNKRFDNFIMLVWVQGSPFHIAAGSHPVQEAWGHKIVCTTVKFKSRFNVVENHANRFLLL